MGFSTLIDIAGAALIGGFMLLLVLRLNQAANENLSHYNGDLIAQQNLVSIIELLEHDFSRIGYCENVDSMVAPEDMILSADSISISFLTDLAQSYTNFRGDGIPDVLIYELGPDVNNTPNPNDKILYRYVQGTSKNSSNLGVTQFKLSYFDNMNIQLPHPIDTKRIAFMQIDLRVEDSYGYDTANDEKTELEKYPTVFWRQIRLATKNMSR